MAIFDKHINNCSRLDWRILINGSISLYFKESVLEDDIKWLKGNDYRIVTQECGGLISEENFHKSIKCTLNFPEYYGENIAAFNDCLLHDLDIPDEGGLVLVLKKFDLFYNANKKIAYEILTQLEQNSRRHLLIGERFIILIQTEKPMFALKRTGGSSIIWNSKEYIDSKRCSAT